MTQPTRVLIELDHTTAIAETRQRGDLAARLARAKARVEDPQIRVVIAGQLKQGKSHLLNSLLNMPVARVGDDESTVLPTVVSYGDPASARLVVARAGGDGPELVDIPVTELGTDLRRAPAARGQEVLRIEVTAPSPLLKGGLAFVDTPAWADTANRTCRPRWACCPTPTPWCWSATPAPSSPNRR